MATLGEVELGTGTKFIGHQIYDGDFARHVLKINHLVPPRIMAGILNCWHYWKSNFDLVDP